MITAGISRVGLGGLAASAALFAAMAVHGPAPVNADTVLMVGGADVQAFPGAENGVYMPAILGGSLCKSDSGNQGGFNRWSQHRLVGARVAGR